MATSFPHGYYSATEYYFREGQADAIVRTTAYHRKDYCRSVIWFSPREHVGIHPSIATPFQRDSHTGLGPLDRLPLELLHDVLLRMDMRSLFNFRQINLRSRQAVDSLRQYQMVCLQEAPETQVQTLGAVRKQFHLTKAESAQLRSFKALPGIYSMNETVHKSHIMLVSTHQTILVSGQQPDTSAQAPPGRHKKFRFMGSCALPYRDKRTGKIEHGISCAGCQLALGKDIIGSRGEKWAFEARDKVYAQDGFLEHFRRCEQAQLLWRSSGEGKNRPAELPEATRRGGYFKVRE
ncbi:uncharacterized protein F4817DRAFT_355530 [Daldinia loculata]|uniref:uncharacterized protein n=1 Tax=Daldinia loculata TaxID=103429 RepID=UPI0020C4399D|nr:uncharacterized protein F4817DRAFT_355530 [Daldinia loculata]KAI1652098.1 hypothetical protein F4817DRAFT_355530 [Daldinia loculata]